MASIACLSEHVHALHGQSHGPCRTLPRLRPGLRQPEGPVSALQRRRQVWLFGRTRLSYRWRTHVICDAPSLDDTEGVGPTFEQAGFTVSVVEPGQPGSIDDIRPVNSGARSASADNTSVRVVRLRRNDATPSEGQRDIQDFCSTDRGPKEQDIVVFVALYKRRPSLLRARLAKNVRDAGDILHGRKHMRVHSHRTGHCLVNAVAGDPRESHRARARNHDWDDLGMAFVGDGRPHVERASSPPQHRSFLGGVLVPTRLQAVLRNL